MNRYSRDQMAQHVARDIPEGAYVNLGIGMPTLVANHIPKDREIVLQSTSANNGRHFIAGRKINGIRD